MNDFNQRYNRVVWVDIPVADLSRAVEFYRATLAIDVFEEQFGDTRFAVLAHEDGNGGCLVVKPDEVASDRGILVYFNVEGRLADAVRQVGDHGGQVVQDVHPIGPHGFRAIVCDSEGNRLALHSMSHEPADT